MIDTVIFDIGNVLVDFDWEGYLNATVEDPAARRAVEDAMRGHGLWDELDRGVMDEADVVAGFVSFAPEYEREIRAVHRHLGQTIHRRETSIPWLRSVKPRARQVLYLSNYSRGVREDNPGPLDFLPLMDGGIFSCDVGLIKPDPAIYARLCEQYRLDPPVCVFIDDVEPNVQAARDFGLQTIHFQTYEQARAELEALLG